MYLRLRSEFLAGRPLTYSHCIAVQQTIRLRGIVSWQSACQFITGKYVNGELVDK